MPFLYLGIWHQGDVGPVAFFWNNLATKRAGKNGKAKNLV